ncbi:TrmH family RNA methyltransferase [Ornithinimicrobium pratense]|uniref:RNA methyltransferase n=1 Tax=Ornithinimicrobium pratense TaxID=2593973 RepID=A0A5J6V4G0_9MICO|nr:RNA methyltransferase [Ornithinimicrobium pratense]QFG68819.1 RNA methyltransferase [Ornithinimicrobium pratense]
MTDRPLVLSNPRSERVRQVAALGRRAARERSGRFLVEGPQAVRELLRYAPEAVEQVYLTEAAAHRHPGLLPDRGHASPPTGDTVRPRPATRPAPDRGHGPRLAWCTEQVISAMADTGAPQGVVAVAQKVDVPLAQALDAVGVAGFVVVLTHVRDPGNAGTVLRGADAFGASAVLVSDASVDVYNPKVVRATVGSLFHLPVSVGTPVPELLRACRERGIRLLAADGAGGTALPDVDLAGAHAWVMGNEAWGLEPEVLALCDAAVSIPIQRAESLNLAMAATVCLHASGSVREQ